jgi:hypothetical protein
VAVTCRSVAAIGKLRKSRFRTASVSLRRTPANVLGPLTYGQRSNIFETAPSPRPTTPINAIATSRLGELSCDKIPSVVRRVFQGLFDASFLTAASRETAPSDAPPTYHLAPSSPAHHIPQHIKTRGWRYLTNLPIRARWCSTKVEMWPITSATKRTMASPPCR